MKTVKISSFLRERKIKLKPQAANCSGLQRIEKIDFSGKIYLSPVQTNTDMILVKSGDLVISGINVEKGALAIYTGEEDVLASIHYSAYEFDAEKIDIDYLKWFLKSNIFRKLLLKQTGSGIKKEIKAKHLLPIEIHLPSLNRQHEIVRQIQGVADYIEEVNQQIQQQAKYAEMLRQSILQQAVEGKLCEQDPNDEPASVLLEKIKVEKERLIAEKKIKKQKPLPPISEEEKTFDLPKGWEWCRLGEICQFVGGFAYKSNRYSKRSSNLIIRLGNVKNDRLLTEINPVYIDDVYANETDQYKINIDDILVTMTGTRGKRDYFYSHCITADDLSSYNLFLNQRVGCLRSIALILPAYLVKFLKSQTILDYIFATETGTANQGNIGSGNIMMIPLPIAPLKEQRRIVEKIDALFLLCDEFEHNISEAQRVSTQLMEAVLQEAFSVQEATKSAQVIEFHPDQTTPETELLAAARGKIREDTWEHLRKRALEIANEES